MRAEETERRVTAYGGITARGLRHRGEFSSLALVVDEPHVTRPVDVVEGRPDARASALGYVEEEGRRRIGDRPPKLEGKRG